MQTNCLSVFEHFVGLALKGLMIFVHGKYNSIREIFNFLNLNHLIIMTILSTFKMRRHKEYQNAR